VQGPRQERHASPDIATTSSAHTKIHGKFWVWKILPRVVEQQPSACTRQHLAVARLNLPQQGCAPLVRSRTPAL